MPRALTLDHEPHRDGLHAAGRRALTILRHSTGLTS